MNAVRVDSQGYYETKYGSPLAYVRAIERLGEAGVVDLAGRKILDFGYGTAGHLRMLASLGAEAVGVDVDPWLAALYARPEDQGLIRGSGGKTGRLRLVNGRFPADPATRTLVGDGYDLILSKNTLKNGYLHPSEPVDVRRRLTLGVEDDRFVRTLFESLRPGGLVLIVNICPAPSAPGQPYKPWADGRCPFPKATWEAAGFQILCFDRDDSAETRTMAHVLGWDRGESPMDLEADLFAQYSLFRRPGTP
jgi:SAM-dependent methyltransferase